MLVHPDKNMGSPLASESFKKVQCAYEVNCSLWGALSFYTLSLSEMGTEDFQEGHNFLLPLPSRGFISNPWT